MGHQAMCFENPNQSLEDYLELIGFADGSGIEESGCLPEVNGFLSK